MVPNLTVIAISVALYTALVIAVGLIKSRGTKGQPTDFFLAGRSLNALLVGFSGAASAESGWVLLGLVGSAYAVGISSVWLIPGCLAGNLFNWLVIAPRLRRAAADTGAVTVPQVMARRHPELRTQIQLLAAAITLVLLIAYVAAQLTAVGKALEAMFGFPYLAGIVLGLAVVFAYVVSGGFRASVWTDLVQALLMVTTLVALPIYAFLGLDASMIETLRQAEGLFDWTSGHIGLGLAGFVLGWAGIGLGYPGQPHVATRFMATRDDRELRIGAIVAIGWSTLVFAGAIAIGLLVRGWLPGLVDSEQALPSFAVAFLPAPIAGLTLAAVIAAICSTADSQLLIATSTLSEDLLRDQGMRPPPERVILVALGILAAAFAALEARVIFDFVLYAWGVLGATLGTGLIVSLLQPRSSGRGVIATMLAGLITVVVWTKVDALSSQLYALIPGFLTSLSVGWWWALRTPALEAERTDTKHEETERPTDFVPPPFF